MRSHFMLICMGQIYLYLYIIYLYLFIFAYSSHMMWVCTVFGYFIHQRIAMLFPYH